MSTTDASLLLEIKGLAKAYPGVQVLSDVNLQLARGEVHALVGENGAGKSTLVKIISGVVPPDAGTMRLRGSAYQPKNKAAAEEAGVRMVLQELNLIPTLTVAENIFLRRLPSRFGAIQFSKLNEAAAKLMKEIGLDIEPERPVHTLGVGQQQLVDIAAGLSEGCDLLILDEPTAALTGAETELLFRQIQRLKAAGTTVVYISHRLEEIRRIADRITVLRNGSVVASCTAGEADTEQIIRWMVGRDVVEEAAIQPRPVGEVALKVENLSRGTVVRDVSFEVRCGEILGLAGLMGSGRTETLRAIFGADRKEGGAVYLRGSSVPAQIHSPRDAVRQGIALLTEDRKSQGLLLSLPIRVNTTLADLGRLAGLGGWIRSSEERQIAERLAGLLALRRRSDEQPVGELSGGNQQKVVIARWLHRDCDVLLFDEPTRGIDVGARFEIYRLLGDLASRGKAICVASSDLRELLAISDRIAVMSAGRLAATFKRGEWTQDRIMAAAFSGYVNAAATEKAS